MKKYLLVTIILLSTFSFAACAQPATTPEPTAPMPPLETAPVAVEKPQFSVPTFQLSQLPELAPYEPPREIVKRYSAEAFVSALKPAADYGCLYPYEGKVYGEQWWETRVYYGLADTQGRVVVDPVYRYTYFTEPEQTGGQPYLLLSYPVDDNDAKAQELLRTSDGFIQRGRYVVAKADGSWVSGDFYGDNVFVSANRIIACNNSENSEDFWSINNQTYRIYDMRGQLVAEGQGSLDSFCEGLARLAYNEYDKQLGENVSYYCYLDADGQVAIPGPFLEAYGFQNGRAVVAIGDSWENRKFTVINTQGEYIVEPSSEWLSSYNYQEKYIVFNMPDNADNRGVKDNEGNIIAPAIYSWINIPYEEGASVAVASKADNSYWLIDLLSGATQRIEIENVNISYAQVYANNWCMVSYDGGAALVKGDKLYRFDSPSGGYVDCRYMKGGLFAINYQQYDEQNRANHYMDVFDTEEGRVVASLPNCRFSHIINDELIIVDSPDSIEHMWALNLDYTPAFNGELGGSLIRSIGWVADDVYSVRTGLFSGLIRPNGEWLLRVNVNTLD